MAMYAIGIQPLIRTLDGITKQVWYADDSAAGSKLEQLRTYWDLLVDIGPRYGYFPNSLKTHVLVKPNHPQRGCLKGREWSSRQKENNTWVEQLVLPYSFVSMSKEK